MRLSQLETEKWQMSSLLSLGLCTPRTSQKMLDNFVDKSMLRDDSGAVEMLVKLASDKGLPISFENAEHLIKRFSISEDGLKHMLMLFRTIPTEEKLVQIAVESLVGHGNVVDAFRFLQTLEQQTGQHFKMLLPISEQLFKGLIEKPAQIDAAQQIITRMEEDGFTVAPTVLNMLLGALLSQGHRDSAFALLTKMINKKIPIEPPLLSKTIMARYEIFF